MSQTLSVLVAMMILAVLPLEPTLGAQRAQSSQTGFKFQTNPTSPFLLNRAPLFGSPLVGADPRSLSRISPLFSHPFRLPGFVWGHRWGQGQQFHVSPFGPSPFFPTYGNYGYYGGPTDSQNNGVQSFIDRWGNQDPFAPKLNSNLSGSSLLSPGMTEEEVTRRLGSPVEKITSGGVEIWKYSSFSVRFEDGLLAGFQ